MRNADQIRMQFKNGAVEIDVDWKNRAINDHWFYLFQADLTETLMIQEKERHVFLIFPVAKH